MDNSLLEIFIQEAEENLQILENLIIVLEENPDDDDRINEAFRAIHSLKGGAGLAGFPAIKDYAHIVEDLFENIRSRTLAISEELISVILNSMDILKSMIMNIKEGSEAGEGIETGESENTIRSILAGLGKNGEDSINKEPEKEETAEKHLFHIRLSYGRDLFLTGIDPLMFLNDLLKCGKILAVNASFPELPDAGDFDPESLYIQWILLFETEQDEKAIADIFCFVIEESEIILTNLTELMAKGISVKEFSVQGINPGEGETTPIPAAEEIKENITPERRRGDRRQNAQGDSYIRVPTDKLEKIFNTVSELLISQARLTMLTEENEEILPDSFTSVNDSLKNITQLLQEQVTSLRMMSLGNTFDRFRRVVRDTATEMGKKIRLTVSGQDTELDKNMIEKLNDPLKHLVRNCIDHGIETKEERLAAGKEEEGHLNLAAYLESGKVVIDVSDDGRGINRAKLLEKAEKKGIITKETRLSDGEILNLIFHPGLSTAEKITDLSGRGVGMDVVRASINELHGNVDIISEEGKGTIFRLYLPLTLAILDGMLVSIGREKYIIPTLAILEIFRPERKHLKTISGGEELVFFRGDYIPLIRLHRLFNISEHISDPSQAEVIVVNNGGVKAAVLVDNVLEQFQIVLKSLQKNYRKVEYISSATILGDGDVALIVDIQSMVQGNRQKQ